MDWIVREDMTTPPEESNIIEKLRRRLTLANRMLDNPKLEKLHVKNWGLVVLKYLKQIYGEDTEIIRNFNNVVDGAVLVSDPRVGLQHL